ncbi:E1 ubiquitin-activating protein [Hanseniaspora uvarum]|nr:E1 ubiquitin-activating protein [Hanseniaspora uvarum]
MSVEEKVDVELYDRQIRLWGMSTQKLILKSNVLVVNLNGLGTEIMKNLLLSGIGNITVLDDHDIDVDDVNTYYNQFFIYKSNLEKLGGRVKRLDIAEANMRDMNPRCNLTTLTTDTNKKLLDKGFLNKFDLVIITEILDNDFLCQINDITRELNLPIYIAQSYGLSSMVFVDYITRFSLSEKLLDIKNDASQIEKEKSIIGKGDFPVKLTKNTELASKELVKNEEDGNMKLILKTLNKFIPFRDLIDGLNSEDCLSTQFNNRQLRNLKQNTTIPFILNSLNPKIFSADEYFTKCKGIELPAVVAVVGAALVQDFISSLNKTKLINNLLLFDAKNDEMPVIEI